MVEKFVKQRKERTIVNEIVPVTKYCYKSLQEVEKYIYNLKPLQNWNCEINTDIIKFTKRTFPYTTPRFILDIDQSLGYTVKVFGIFHNFL